MELRRSEITRLLNDKHRITSEEGSQLLVNKNVLNCRDGRRLCSYLIAEKLGLDSAWKLFSIAVVEENYETKTYESMGNVINSLYKQSSNSKSANSISKLDVEEQLYEPLIRNTILTQPKYAEKFAAILRGSVDDLYGGVAEMLFRVSKPLIWRYLDATNASVRLGAFRAQVLVFPPKTSDPIEESTYFGRHYDALNSALLDESIAVCIQAIESTFKILSVWWDNVPTTKLEKMLQSIITLSSQEVVEIRVAVIQGLRLFANCRDAAHRMFPIIKTICTAGIDDEAEKVRLFTCKLLCLFQENETFKTQTIVPFKNLLFRLDFEENQSIEFELSKYIFTHYFCRTLSNTSRYNFVKRLCSVSKLAVMDMHRHLTDFMTTEDIVYHLNAIVHVATCLLNEIGKRGQSTGQIVSTTPIKNSKNDWHEAVGMEPEAEEDEPVVWSSTTSGLKSVKDILDCAIVCYARTQEKFVRMNNDSFLGTLCRRFLDVVQKIFDYNEIVDEDLHNTALTIMSFVKVKGMSVINIINTTERLLRGGRLDKRTLEIFGMHDMTQILKIIDEGLTQLVDTSSKMKSVQSSPTKRIRTRTFSDEIVVLDSLNYLLSSSTCSQYIHTEYGMFVDKFADKLEKLRDNYMLKMRKNYDFDRKLFLSVYETWTVVTILRHAVINKKEEPKRKPRRGIKRKISGEFVCSFTTQTDPLILECEWFQRQYKAKPAICKDQKFLDTFLCCLGLHFRAYNHTKSAVDLGVDVLNQIEREITKRQSKSFTLPKSLTECRKHSIHAANFATDQVLD
ncbi:hypothetical protein M3Y98_00114600 [Aphelenchoides besseyi]|nr:hypothetical protein M3Y98_00114600 [Aphelenchoides besseyi]KAI6199443.1 hypothetical protein M3Y96_00627700 [Aphelenchoides besseyi]